MLNSINNRGDGSSVPLLVKDKDGNTRIIYKDELTTDMEIIKYLTKTVMTKNDLRAGRL